MDPVAEQLGEDKKKTVAFELWTDLCLKGAEPEKGHGHGSWTRAHKLLLQNTTRVLLGRVRNLSSVTNKKLGRAQPFGGNLELPESFTSSQTTLRKRKVRERYEVRILTRPDLQKKTIERKGRIGKTALCGDATLFLRLWMKAKEKINRIIRITRQFAQQLMILLGEGR